MPVLSITQFNNHTASAKQEHAWANDELDEYVIDPPVSESKSQCAWIKLAKFGNVRTQKNSLRHDANVISISGAEGDYDGKVMPIAEAACILDQAGIKATLYTSPSYSQEKPKWRVLVPFSHEFEGTKEELKAIRSQMLKRVDRVLGYVFASESYTLSQSFYIGQVKGVEYKSISVDGDYVDQRNDLNVEELKAPVSKGITKAADSYSFDSAVAAIFTEENYHTSMRDIAMSYIGLGHSPDKAKTMLRSIFESSPNKREKWQDRYDYIGTAVDTAFAKQKKQKVGQLTDNFIYIDTLDVYFRKTDKQILKPAALNRNLRMQFPDGAAIEFDKSPDKVVASGLGWLPVKDGIIELNGVSLVNTYAGIQTKPISGDVVTWLKLCQHIYGEHADLVLDHWAYSIQHPLKKIRWQILVCGEPRTGKSLTSRPVVKIWGNAGVSMSPEEVQTGWGDGLVGKKFVSMEEVYMPENKAFFNGLKIRLANDDLERINPKGKGVVIQPNLYSMILFTNHVNALHFEENDDKLLVINAPSEKWEKADYIALGTAIDEGEMTNHIYDFLLKRDVSDFSYSALPVRTDAAIEMARESMPDYQKALIDMIDSQQWPFNQSCFTLDDLRKQLQERRYGKFGDKGITEILLKKGIHRYRGQKKVSGVVTTTPRFWAVTTLAGYSPSQIYDWYTRETKNKSINRYDDWR